MDSRSFQRQQRTSDLTRSCLGGGLEVAQALPRTDSFGRRKRTQKRVTTVCGSSSANEDPIRWRVGDRRFATGMEGQALAP